MRILWLKTELLHPVDKGGKIRTYQMLRAIARDHEVTYLTLDDGSGAPDARELAAEYCSRLVTVPFSPPRRKSPAFFLALAGNLFSRLPYSVQRYASPTMKRRIAEEVATSDYDVVVCDFLFPAASMPAGLAIPTVLFQHNVEAEIWRRHTEVAVGPRKAYFGLQWRRMRRFEREACARFDRVIAVSAEDAETFRREYGLADVSWVPTGVDVDYFSRSGTRQREPNHLVFTGSMDWMPNEDGIVWFVRQVLPRIRETVPEARLTVVGRLPGPGLLALAGAVPGVEFTGRVPDVRPWLERATLSIVPLRVGGGTRLKIYEAMAMECPVVSTTIGAEGLPLMDGEHLRLADDPVAMAEACAELLRTPQQTQGMAGRAAHYVRSSFGWDGVARTFVRLCEEATAEAGSSQHVTDYTTTG